MEHTLEKEKVTVFSSGGVHLKYRPGHRVN
jgi:hypothetical protein